MELSAKANLEAYSPVCKFGRQHGATTIHIIRFNTGFTSMCGKTMDNRCTYATPQNARLCPLCAETMKDTLKIIVEKVLSEEDPDCYSIERLLSLVLEYLGRQQDKEKLENE